MNFDIGERVRVMGREIAGTVTHIKHEKYYHNSKVTESIRYCVSFNTYYQSWYNESDLEPIISYEFSDEFEIGLRDFLIDTHLKHHKFDVVKKLSEQKYVEVIKCPPSRNIKRKYY
jgi:hypothetical protein